ncbi:MAG TPA: chaperonin GroEL [Candidatus Eisenbacteria bacterium]|nr:chaperonin GroEL [Candidatus Eisenbacteria bacterium]
MGKRIEFDDAARAALRRGVDQLAGAVRVTLGPRGRNVVIDHRDQAPTITNDGITIAREVELENPFENMGVQLVREVALKTGQVAGDGTTTATVLAHRLIVGGLDAVLAGRNPVAIKRGIERASATAVEALRVASRTLRTDRELAQIAAVSAQDAEAGEIVAAALQRVGRRGVVAVEEGHGFETTLEVVEGVRVEGGYLSPYFVTDPGSMEVALDHPLVMLTDMPVVGARELLVPLEHVAHSGRPLLLVANEIESEALATLVVNRLRGAVSSVAVRLPMAGEKRRAVLDDLAVLTGGTFLSRELGRPFEQVTPADFGRARRVVVDRDSTAVIEGGGDPRAIRERIGLLEKQLEHADAEFDRDALRERLARLHGGIAVIRVGGATEFERSERRARFEDALAATQAAVAEGVVPGGGVALLRAQSAVRALELPGDEALGRDLVLAALEEPVRQIALNAGEDPNRVVARIREGTGAFGYDALTGTFADLDAAGICDPVLVTRTALQHAASIAAMVLTTDAIVVETEDDEESGADDDEEQPPEAE